MAGSTSGISPSFLGLSRSSGQVTHVLLTRSRLCPRPKPGSSLHLHVLSTPPAFVLSQDQTLREELLAEPEGPTVTKELSWPVRDAQVHRGRPDHDGSTDSNNESGRTPIGQADQVRMLLSFQRPPCLSGKGTPSEDTPADAGLRDGPGSIARLGRGASPRAARRSLLAGSISTRRAPP